MTLEIPSEPLKILRQDLQPKKRKIPLPPSDIEEKRESFKQFQATKEWLERTFPKTFNFKDPKPLKLGIQHNLLSITCPFSRSSLRHCLGVYANSRAYLEAIVQEKWRYDLNGEKIEEITQEQRAHALKMLEHKKVLLEKIRKENILDKDFK